MQTGRCVCRLRPLALLPLFLHLEPHPPIPPRSGSLVTTLVLLLYSHNPRAPLSSPPCINPLQLLGVDEHLSVIVSVDNVQAFLTTGLNDPGSTASACVDQAGHFFAEMREGCVGALVGGCLLCSSGPPCSAAPAQHPAPPAVADMENGPVARL
jgi:hypothetical protein